MEVSGAQPLEPRGKEAIKQDLQNTNKELKKRGEDFTIIFDSLDENTQQRIGSVFEKVEAKEISPEEAKASFDETSPVQQLVVLYGQVKDAQKRQQDLQKEYLPFKLDEVKERVKNLSSRLNFQNVFGYYDKIVVGSDDLFANTADELFFLRKTEVGIITGALDRSTYDWLDHIDQTLVQYGTVWEQKGFLKTETDADYEFSHIYGGEVAEKRRILVARIQEADRCLIYGTYLVNTYKPKMSYSFNSLISGMDRTFNLEEDVLRSDDVATIDYDPRFIEAASQYLEQKTKPLAELGDFPQDEETRRVWVEQGRRDAEEVLKNIQILGFEEVHGERLIVTKEQVLQELREKIPPYFLVGIRSIQAVKQDQIKGLIPEDKLAYGLHDPVYDEKGNYTGSNIYVLINPRSAYKGPVEGEKRYEEFMRASFMDVLFHELGHSMHHNLTYDEMAEWETARTSEHAYVSEYVRHCYEESGTRGRIEDFAETFANYVRSESILRTKSGSRADYMSRLVNTYQQQS